MKVIVIGATGFLGSNTISRMAHEKIDLIAFGRNERRLRIIRESGIETIVGDLTQSISDQISFDGIDWLVHLASVTSPLDSIVSPENDHLNFSASKSIFRDAIEGGVRKIIFGSSGGTIYGDPLKNPIDEAHPTNPLIPYARTKLEIESELLSLCDRTKTVPIVLRFGNPYGPNQYSERGTGVVTAWLESARDKRPIVIFGDGENARDFFYVTDAVNAILGALQGNAHGIYNIGTGVPVRMNDLLNVIQEVTDLDLIIERHPPRPSDKVKSIALDSTKALRDFGWRHQVDLRKGILSTWKWILDGEPFSITPYAY